MSQYCFIKKFSTYVLFGMATLVAHAEPTKFVVRDHRSQEVFEIVLEGEAKTKPGIYRIENSATTPTSPMIFGSVLGATERRPGVLYNLNASSSTDQQVLLAVVDGKLVFLKHDSSAKAPSTKLIFGNKDKSYVLIKDPLTSSMLMLNPILKEEDINIYSNSLVENGETQVLVSVRQANPNTQSTGLTFIFRTTIHQDNEASLNKNFSISQPLLIDYHFHSNASLKHLSALKSPHRPEIVSPYIAEAIANRWGNPSLTGDHPLIEQWIKAANIVREYATPDSTMSSSEFNARISNCVLRPDLRGAAFNIIMPTLNYLTGEVKLLDSTMSNAGTLLTQRFEGLGRGLLYNVNVDGNTEPKPGTIQWDPSAKKFLSRSIPSGSLVPSLSALDNATIAILPVGDDQKAEIDLKPTFDALGIDPFNSQTVMSHIRFPYLRFDPNIAIESKSDIRRTHPSEAYHFIFVSSPSNASGKPVTAVIRLYENYLRLSEKDIAPIVLFSKRLSQKELEFRYLIQMSPGYPLVFDKESRVAGEKAYARVTNTQENGIRFTPYLNLFEEAPTKTAVYLRSRLRFSIFKDLEFQEFGEAGEKNDSTGIYLEQAGNLPKKQILPGYLIYSAKKDPQNPDKIKYNPLIHFQDITIHPENHVASQGESLDISMMGMLPTPTTNGALNPKFNLVFVVHKAQVFQAKAEIEVPFSLSMIEGVQLVQGVRKRRNAVYAMIFLKKTSSYSGGIYSIALKINEKDQKDLGSTPEQKYEARTDEVASGTLVKNSVSLNAITKQLIADENGSLYWVETPELSPHDRDYRVRPFDSPRKLIVVADSPEIKLMPNETVDFDSSSRNGRKLTWFGSHWELRSWGDFIKVNAVISKILQGEKLGKAKEEVAKLERDGTKGSPLYPELDTFLTKELRDPKNLGRKTFLVVSEGDYERIYNLILLKAATGTDTWDSYGYSAPLKLFHFNGKTTLKDAIKEITLAATDKTKSVLFAGTDELLEASSLGIPSTSNDPVSILDVNNDLATDFGSKKSNDRNDDTETDTSDDEKPSKDGKKEESTDNANTNDVDADDEDFIAKDEDESVVLSENPEVPNNYRKASSDKFQISGLFLIATEGSGRKETDIEQLPALPSLTSLILTTPRKLKALQQVHEREFKAGLESHQFSIDTRFLRSPWFTWSPGTTRSESDVRQMSVAALTSEDLNVFPNLRELLTGLANSSKTPSRKILVVPKNIKDLLMKYIMTHWASRYGVVMPSSKTTDGIWNFRNDNLKLFRLPHGTDRLSQENVFDNLGAMRAAATTNKFSVVLLSDGADLIKTGRPVPDEKSTTPPFKIADPASMKRTELIASAHGDSKTSRMFPHILWWLSSEGKRVQPKIRDGWRLSSEVPPTFSQLILATPEEMADLRRDLGIEANFMDLEADFEINSLTYPSLEHRANLLRALFKKDEIKALGYEVEWKEIIQDANGESNASFNKFTEFTASRIEAVARSLNQEPIEAFIRAYSLFRRSLIEDPSLRRTRRLDDRYIERFLAKVFPIPLNLKSLEPDDVLLQIQDVPKSSVELIRLGHAGQMSLKERVLRLILSQTQGSDSSKQIPASAIFYGNTSLGKTFLFEKIIELLKLKVYDYERPNDEKAQAFKLIVEDLVETEAEAGGKNRTVDEALKHLDHFLSLPMGYRGFVLIDDLHKAKNAKILSRVMQYMQNMMNNNLVKVRSLNNQTTIEVPVRNIVLIVTINPASSRRVRQEYEDDSKSLESRIVAALSQVQGASYEASILARFADLIDFDDFPREAKASGLIKRIRSRSGQDLTLNKRLVLVNPEILSDLAEMFPNAHARNFLSPVTNGLFSQVESDLDAAPLYFVTRKVRHFTDDEYQIDRREWETLLRKGSSSDSSSQIDALSLGQKIRERVVVKPINPDSIQSRLEFMQYTSNAFRIHLFNSLIDASQSDPVMAGNFNNKNIFLLPFLGSNLGSLRKRPSLAYWNMEISSDRLGVSSSLAKTKELEKLLAEKREESRSVIPASLSSIDINHLDDLSVLTGSEEPVSHVTSQLDVMKQTTEKLRTILQELQYQFFRSDHFQEDNVEAWFAKIKETPSSEKAFEKAAKRIARLYLEFVSQDGMLNPRIKEIASQKSGHLTSFDYAQLFYLCVDKAITLLAWDSSNHFMLRMLQEIASEPTLANRAEFMEYAFQAEDSPFNPITTESVTQLLDSNDLILENTVYLDQRHEEFKEHCEHIFDGGVNRNSNQPGANP